MTFETTEKFWIQLVEYYEIETISPILRFFFDSNEKFQVTSFDFYSIAILFSLTY